MGLKKTTDKENWCIIVGINFIIKFVFMKGVSSKSVKEIADYIFEYIALEYGCAKILHTDNGK